MPDELPSLPPSPRTHGSAVLGMLAQTPYIPAAPNCVYLASQRDRIAPLNRLARQQISQGCQTARRSDRTFRATPNEHRHRKQAIIVTAPKTAAELRESARDLLEQAALLETPITQSDLQSMTADQIETARRQGRLDSLLGRK